MEHLELDIARIEDPEDADTAELVADLRENRD